MTRILGIDPGLLHTGWAVIDSVANERKYIASGVILPNPKLPMAARLAEIFSGVSALCDDFRPSAASMEIIFINKNPTTTLLLGQARGTAIAAIGIKNIPLYEYEPNVIKKAITGAGHADKDQINAMVKILLPSAKPKSPDEADALAIALTQANMNNKLIMNNS